MLHRLCHLFRGAANRSHNRGVYFSIAQVKGCSIVRGNCIKGPEFSISFTTFQCIVHTYRSYCHRQEILGLAPACNYLFKYGTIHMLTLVLINAGIIPGHEYLRYRFNSCMSKRGERWSMRAEHHVVSAATRMIGRSCWSN